MSSIKIRTSRKTLLADTLTPIGIFLKIRKNYKNSVILESADYHGKEHGFSHIAFDPVARFELTDSKVTQTFPDGTQENFTLANRHDAVAALKKITSLNSLGAYLNSHFIVVSIFFACFHQQGT